MTTNTISPNQSSYSRIHTSLYQPQSKREEPRLCSSALDESNAEIKLLYCPSTSNLVPYTASNSDLINIGGVANVFGLEPSTVKINGHFIGRGPDLIATSVTWKGLICFFEARGLPSGVHQPILVSGRILKAGSKRRYEPPDDEQMSTCLDKRNHSFGDDICWRTRNRNERAGPSKKYKLSNTGYQGYEFDTANKRKHFLQDDLSFLKKLKIDEAESSRKHEGDLTSETISGQSNETRDLFSEPLKTHIPCIYSNQKLKRTREEETVVAMPPKRIK